MRMKMGYKFSTKSRYNKTPGVYVEKEPSEKRKRRSFKQWLRDYLKEDNFTVVADTIPGSLAGSHIGFNKSFEGWTIRLHRANGGHIVEAWKSDEGPQPHNYRAPHELFMVNESDDMGARLNDILVQLMLRG